MPVICHSCSHPPFEDFKELALHISTSRKGHRKGKRWAAKYIMVNGLSLDKKNGRKTIRTPLTESDRESRESVIRVLSGKFKSVLTLCPRCKDKTYQELPVEFASSPDAWRIKDMLAVTCQNCQ